MKILQIIQKPQFRGAEIFASQLSEILKVKGVEVDVAYLYGNENECLNYNIKYFPLGGNQEVRFFDFKAYKNLHRLIINGDYNLIQANAGDTLKYAAISKYIHAWKQPLVFRNANYISGFINSKPKKWLNNLWVRKCDHIISVSESCRQDFIEVFPSHRHKSTTITIGTYDWSEINDSSIKSDLNIIIFS